MEPSFWMLEAGCKFKVFKEKFHNISVLFCVGFLNAMNDVAAYTVYLEVWFLFWLGFFLT